MWAHSAGSYTWQVPCPKALATSTQKRTASSTSTALLTPVAQPGTVDSDVSATPTSGAVVAVLGWRMLFRWKRSLPYGVRSCVVMGKTSGSRPVTQLWRSSRLSLTRRIQPCFTVGVMAKPRRFTRRLPRVVSTDRMAAMRGSTSCRFLVTWSTGEPMNGTGSCGITGACGQTWVAIRTSPARRSPDATRSLSTRALAADLRRMGIRHAAVVAVFAPLRSTCEEAATAILLEELPELSVTLSHDLGQLGLLERENAAVLNAALKPLAERTINAIRQALVELGLRAPLYLTQNDGTLMSADYAERFPVLTFASGPANSMRGAAYLSGLRDAIVVDVGGTSSDFGALVGGFPREAGIAVTIGGVRTNFRMPDLLSLGLGSGSVVTDNGRQVGPRSVGHRLVEEGLIFGGSTLTASDIAVAAGRAAFRPPDRVRGLEPAGGRTGPGTPPPRP